MKLTQSTIFHTQTNGGQEIDSFIKQIVTSTLNNPDYLEINSQDKQSIGIKQIKELISWLQMRPYQEENKLAVIQEAEKMTVESQNSLLKVLEEPPAKSYIFLLTQNPKSLLPTVLSRTNLISPNSDLPDHVQHKIDILSITRRVPRVHIEKIEEFTKIKDPKMRKQEIRKFLEALHKQVIDSTSGRVENLSLLQQTNRALNSNTNTKLILENLFFNFVS